MWVVYAKACYGSTPIPMMQYVETRRAFYSGILSAMTAMVEKAKMDNESNAAMELENLTKEVLEFLDTEVKTMATKPTEGANA